MYFSNAWESANEYCKENKGSLVSINSELERNAIIQFLHDNGFDYNKIWIGLNDIEDEGVYVWKETGENSTYFDWSEGIAQFN